jgi:TM2 domain-containing membrane protein YozV
MIFQQQYESVRRDEVVGVLLALFLGGFGIHHFYLGRTGLGIVYLIFSWTGIPWIIAWVECFFMPARVRMYNAVQAAGLAAALGITLSGYAPAPVYVSVQTGAGNAGIGLAGEPALLACGNCGQANGAGARFCSACGRALTLG